MATVRRWTGLEAKRLRGALRLSIRDFAAYLGVGIRTVTKWEARQAGITPLPHMQAVLDTVLARASDEAKARFAAMAHAEAHIDQDSVRPSEPRVRGGLLPVVVNGCLVFVPFDADTPAANSLDTLFGELQHVVVGLDQARGSVDYSVVDYKSARHSSQDQGDLTLDCPGRQELPEIDDMNRRELLRLMSAAAALLAKPPTEDLPDWERLDSFTSRTSRPDSAVLDDYARLNAHLWRAFASSKSKRVAFPLVRKQLDVLSNALQQSQGSDTHQRLSVLAGDLFQLAGEIFFDCNQYTDAAHCYTLAATASKEANAFDLWTCALTVMRSSASTSGSSINQNRCLT